MQGIEKALASAFVGTEGSYPEAWSALFKKTDEFQKLGQHKEAALITSRVLKALVWGADAVALKSAKHRDAYADVTMFVRNWAPYAHETALTASGLKMKAEAVADNVLNAQDKMKCLRCNTNNHLNSMCVHKEGKQPFRQGRLNPRDNYPRDNYRDEDRRDDDNARSGFGNQQRARQGFGNRREDRDRDQGRRNSGFGRR